MAEFFGADFLERAAEFFAFKLFAFEFFGADFSVLELFKFEISIAEFLLACFLVFTSSCIAIWDL